jgi:hypothetical protein
MDCDYWTKALREAERELETATTRTSVNAAAKKLQRAKAELKQLEDVPAEWPSDRLARVPHVGGPLQQGGMSLMAKKGSFVVSGLILLGVPFVAEAGPKTMSGCTYEYGGLSVEHMARDGSPVLYQWFDCQGQLVRRYIDFTGAEMQESALVPSVRHRIVDYLEDRLGVDITDPTDDLLENIAISHGLI